VDLLDFVVTVSTGLVILLVVFITRFVGVIATVVVGIHASPGRICRRQAEGFV
jgi:hypothetical protein